jgi:hypothetical protein
MFKRFALVSALGVAAAAVAFAVVPGSAKADSSTTVSLLGCAFDTGSTTVPAGDVTLHLGGYAEGTLGLIQNVLLAQATTLQVGTTSYDLSNQWSAPVFNPLGFWVIRQPDFDIGTLTAGQSVTVTYDITFSRPVAVLFPPVGPSGDNGPFIIGGEGPFSCTITANT